ncbi:hypothetical protein HYV11_02800 [Candidatus Dependentiae bacterium]|nr:hypothetical protein [Candidatus Dependentiae bacterium]
MEKAKRQEQELRFEILFFISISFHFIIFLFMFLFYLEEKINNHHLKKNDSTQIFPAKKELKKMKKEEPILWKDLKKEKVQKEEMVALIPGKKGILESLTQKSADSTAHSTKTIEQQIPTKSSENKEKFSPHTPSSLPTDQQKIIAQPSKTAEPLPNNQEKNITLNNKSFFSNQKQDQEKKEEEKSKINRLLEMKNKLLQASNMTIESVNHQESHASQQSNFQKISSNDTITTKKITLQDLQLGFSNFIHQEGNNDILIRQGNSNKTANPHDLRLITYIQQVARTMKEAIITHTLFYKVQEIRNYSILFKINYERDGKFISYELIEGSKYPLIDRIVKESLESIKLYPAIPNHITDKDNIHVWRFIG